MHLKNLNINIKVPEVDSINKVAKIAYTESMIVQVLFKCCIYHLEEYQTPELYRYIDGRFISATSKLLNRISINQWEKEEVQYLIDSLNDKINDLKVKADQEDQFDLVAYFSSILEAIKEARKDL